MKKPMGKVLSKLLLSLVALVCAAWTLCGGGQVAFAAEEVEVADGLYFIHVESDNHFVVNINGNSTEDGANIDIQQNANLNCQKFQITKQEDGYYRITSLSAQKDLTVAEDSPEKEANVQLETYSGKAGQKWSFALAGEDRYYIISSLGTYMDNYGGNLTDGNNVWMYENNGSATQMWMLTEAEETDSAAGTSGTALADHPMTFEGTAGGEVAVPDGEYCINVEADNNYVMNINGNRTDDGATIDIMTNNNLDCQKFQITALGDGYYSIISVSSGKSLDVAGGSADAETDLQQRTYDGSDGQKWRFIYVDEERVKIQSALGTYIDNYAGNIADANNVWMYGESESMSQVWMLTQVMEAAVPAVETTVTEETTYVDVAEDNGVTDGLYRIVLADNSELSIGAMDGFEDNGANVGLVQGEGMTLKIQNDGDGYFSILLPDVNKSLDIDGGSREQGANLQLYNYDGTDGQKWILQAAGDGSFYLVSRLETMVGYAEESAGDGTNLIMEEATGEGNQRWRLVPAA